jgi:choice-of-anchor B domain-containing protein
MPWRCARERSGPIVDLERAFFTLALVLMVVPAPQGPAAAQVVSAAHEDSEWESDRQSPYGGDGWLESQGGSPSVAFSSAGVALRSWISLGDFDAAATSANDCWGYVSPSGREYALVGLSLGTGFVEVTDPANAQIVDVLPGPTSSWRDIKTYQEYAYAVSEGGGGIQVFDLSQIDSGIVSLVNTVTSGGRLATHDVALNPESGMLYRVGGGGSNPVQGLRIYSLADPNLPVFAGEWHDRYCHDAQVVTWSEAPYAGVEVAFCYADDTATSGNPGIEILDVSDPQNVSVIGSINLALPPIFSHPASYSHQGWLSPDRHYVYFNDEVDEYATGNPTTTRIIDVSNLSNPTQVAIFSNGNSARDHNLFTLGDLIFEANYRSGLRVFDARDPLAPFEFAFFDTYPEDDDARYNGLWGVYPYFPSGTIIGSDIEKGLFVWTLAAAAPVPSSSPPLALLTALLMLAAGAAALRRRRGTSRADAGS